MLMVENITKPISLKGYKLVIGDKGKVVKIISPYQLSNVPLQ